MSILVYDEIWAREPRLMVPGQKPIGPVRLREGSKITHAWTFHNPALRDVLGLWNASIGSASIRTGAKGLELYQNNQSVAMSNAPFALEAGSTQLIVVKIDTDNISMLGLCGNSYNDGGYSLARFPGGAFYIAGGAGYNTFTGVSYSIGTWLTAVICGARARLCANGTFYTADGAQNAPTAVRYMNAIPGYNLTGSTSLLLYWPYSLSDAEMYSYYLDPWQDFIPA